MANTLLNLLQSNVYHSRNTGGGALVRRRPNPLSKNRSYWARALLRNAIADILKPEKRKSRTLLLESLDARHLLAADAIQPLVASLEEQHGISEFVNSPAHVRISDALVQIEDSSETTGDAKEVAASAAQMGDLTYEPVDAIAGFQASLPTLADLQQDLLGNGMFSSLDFGAVDNHQAGGQNATTISAEQIEQLAHGSFMQIFPKNASGKEADKVAGLGSKFSGDAHHVLGGFCNVDGSHGTLITRQFVEGTSPEGEDSGSLPTFAFPALEIASYTGTPDSFSPAGQSSGTVVTTHGSFTMASLDNPDLDADGTNWVHYVDRIWNNANSWSFTERLAFVFNTGQITSDGGDISELISDSTGGSGSGDDSDEPALDNAGDWSSSTETTRQTMFVMTFTASVGISTPTAGGVAWSIDIRFGDTVGVSSEADGSGTATPAEGDDSSSGDDDDAELPDDFTAHSTWGATAGLTLFSRGNFTVSSTPEIGSDGIVARRIQSGGGNKLGGGITFGTNWSSSSQSGDLEPIDGGTCQHCSSGAPSSPLPDGGNLGLTMGDAGDAIGQSDPENGNAFDPIGDFEGTGHASSSSGLSTATAGGSTGGGWQFGGLFKGGQWSEVLGDAHGELHGNTGGGGGSQHAFILIMPPSVEPLPNGTKTTNVTMSRGWMDEGNESEVTVAEAISDFMVGSGGQLETQDTGEAEATIDGGANAKGYNFTNITASIKTTEAWSIHNEPTSAGEVISNVGTQDGETTIVHSYASHGRGLGSYETVADELSEQNASATSDLSGRGIELLKITKSGSHNHDKEETVHDEYLILHDEGEYGSTEKFVNTYFVEGLLTATLNADGTVTWSGSATETTTSRMEYDSDSFWDAYEYDDYGSGSDWGYIEDRNATFARSAVLVATFNAATGQMDNSFSTSGDSKVHLSGHNMYEEPFTDADKTDFELALESLYLDGQMGYPTPPEPDPNGGLPPDYEYPSNPGSSGFISWFGGTAGDSADQAMYFVYGAGDNVLLGTTKAFREYVGIGSVDYDGTAYAAGEWAGFVGGFVSGGAYAKGVAICAAKAGTAKGFLKALWNGGCFVAGTKVTLSEMPRGEGLEDSLWSEPDFDWSNGDSGHRSPWEASRVPLAEENDLSLGEPTALAAGNTQTIAPALDRLQIPIEDVPLGARVPTKNPKPWEYDDSLPEPDEDTWQVVKFTVTRKNGGVVDAELLRPRSWVEANGLEVGRLLPIDIEELQIEGSATRGLLRSRDLHVSL